MEIRTHFILKFMPLAMNLIREYSLPYKLSVDAGFVVSSFERIAVSILV